MSFRSLVEPPRSSSCSYALLSARGAHEKGGALERVAEKGLLGYS